MNRFSLTHLTDGAVLHGLKSNLARERDALADVLAHIAEVDARKLYVPAGYESMHEYCLGELHLSKDATKKRIHAARTAIDFPKILERIAEGALGLSAVNALAPYLTADNAAELLAAAAFKPREEVRQLLAERFPQAVVATTIEPIAQPMTLTGTDDTGRFEGAPAHLQGVVNPPQVMPLAADLYKLTLTMTGAMRAKLLRAVELFGRRKPVPDEAEILELGLELLVRSLEKKKFAATDKPRARRRCRSADHIPADVQRKVWERDGGQCTFESDAGRRCASRMDLEFDHIVPRGRGGRSNDEHNLRLRCRPHNQYEAERVYGKAFMQNKRDQARAAAAKRRAEKEAKRAAQEALENDELMPGLRGLGFTKEEAQFALSKCPPMGEATIETRLRQCLAMMLPPHRKLMPTGT